MIVVEGPDGSGKSTIVAELCRRLDLQQGERSTTNRDELYKTTVPDSYDAVMSAAYGITGPRVWDRMFYSDPIYAHITRDEESRFTDPQFMFLHRMVLAMKCPIVLCLPPLEVVRANVLNSEQMPGVVEHIDDIYNAYRDLADEFRGGSQLIVYDYTIRGSIPRLCSRLREYLHHRKARLR